jgi:hypothetical protein
MPAAVLAIGLFAATNGRLSSFLDNHSEMPAKTAQPAAFGDMGVTPPHVSNATT